MSEKTALISGIGIGGPTLAFWLQAAGFKPTLIEHAPALRTDPACGSGIFLCEVLRALERHNYQGHVDLIGLDVSATAIAMARFALDRGDFIDQRGLTTTVRTVDFLSMDERLDADVVLMNPPFLAMPEMDANARARLQQILGDTFRYRPDLSMAFTSLALHHLQPGGTLATLLPAGALSQTGGVKWRDGLLRGNDIALIAVLGDHGLFRDALVNVAALVLRKADEPTDVASTMLWASQKRGASSAALRRLRRWHAGNRNAERTIDWSIYPTSSACSKAETTGRRARTVLVTYPSALSQRPNNRLGRSSRANSRSH